MHPADIYLPRDLEGPVCGLTRHFSERRDLLHPGFFLCKDVLSRLSEYWGPLRDVPGQKVPFLHQSTNACCPLCMLGRKGMHCECAQLAFCLTPILRSTFSFLFCFHLLLCPWCVCLHIWTCVSMKESIFLVLCEEPNLLQQETAAL